MSSPYSPAPGAQGMHYPQPHDPMPAPIDAPQQLPQPTTPLGQPLQQPQQFQQPQQLQQPPFQQFEQLQPIPPPLQPLPVPPLVPVIPPYPVPFQPPIPVPPTNISNLPWAPFHMQSLIPPDTPPHDILQPSELAVIVPLRTDTHVDRDLALLLGKAHKYGGAVPGGHTSRHKYAKYTFLAGLLLAKRGLPAVAIPDDPDDPYVRLLQIYLVNTNRLGADPDSVLMKTLAKGGRSGYYYEDTGRRSDSRRSRSGSRRSRSGSRRSRSGSRRSGSGRRSERKSSSRNYSTDTSDWEEC